MSALETDLISDQRFIPANAGCVYMRPVSGNAHALSFIFPRKEVLCVKCCQTALHVTEILFLKSHQCSKFVLFLKMATTTPNFSNHHPAQSTAINMEAEPFTSKKVMAGWCLDNG